MAEPAGKIKSLWNFVGGVGIGALSFSPNPEFPKFPKFPAEIPGPMYRAFYHCILNYLIAFLGAVLHYFLLFLWIRRWERGAGIFLEFMEGNGKKFRDFLPILLRSFVLKLWNSLGKMTTKSFKNDPKSQWE